MLGNLSAKIFQKNRILNHINEKILGMEKILHLKDDKIFELNNELLYYKNLFGNNISLTSFDFPELNVSNSISVCKKKKMDEYVQF